MSQPDHSPPAGEDPVDANAMHPTPSSMIEFLYAVTADSRRTARLIMLLAAIFGIASVAIALVGGVVLLVISNFRSSPTALSIATGLGSAIFGSTAGLSAAYRRRRRKIRALEDLELTFQPERVGESTPDGETGDVA
jgi:hypothetical protein